MRRLLVVCVIAALCVPVVVGVADGSSSGDGTPANATASAKKKKCKKGYVKKRVKGKTRCVKKKKAAPKVIGGEGTTPAPAQPVTDPAQVKQRLLGSLWFWTQFDQAGTGGTTDRTHVNLCADGRFRLRRSSTTTDGQGSSFTVIIEDLSSAFDVVSGSYNPGTGDLEAKIGANSEQRRARTASGPEFSSNDGRLEMRLALRGGQAFIDDLASHLITDEPPSCDFE